MNSELKPNPDLDTFLFNGSTIQFPSTGSYLQPAYFNYYVAFKFPLPDNLFSISLLIGIILPFFITHSGNYLIINYIYYI